MDFLTFYSGPAFFCYLELFFFFFFLIIAAVIVLVVLVVVLARAGFWLVGHPAATAVFASAHVAAV